MSALPVRVHTSAGSLRMLGLIVALFLLPFAIASGLFALGWRPGGHSSGELTQLTSANQAQLGPLSFADLRPAASGPAPDTLAGRWTLALLSRGPCDARCETLLASLRRVQVATYKNMPRVRRLWVASEPAALAAAARLHREWPDLVAASAHGAAWQAALPAPGGATHQLLLLDPAGRPVLRYADPFDPRGVLHDLQRLLKYSWIG